MSTSPDRIEAIRGFGYSPNEARFIAFTALHSGMFLRRQYSGSDGAGRQRLCDKLLGYDHGKVERYGKNQRLYHITAKPIYAALGETDNRNRRQRNVYRTRYKLMALDYALLHPEYGYLPTETDKLNYFHDHLGVPLEALPNKIYTGDCSTPTRRFFIDQCPIRLGPSPDDIAFCYIDAGIFTDSSFRTWLRQYTPLIRAIGRAEIIYVACGNEGYPHAGREVARTFADQDIRRKERAEYLDLKRSLEEKQARGFSIEQIRRFHILKAAYGDTATETPQDEPQAQAAVKFSTYRIEHSYAWLGSLTDKP